MQPSTSPCIRRALGPGLVALGLVLGCASMEGARLYASGTEALEQGDTGRAVAELEEAARLLPGASEVHNHLGLAYARAGRDERALAAFRRAVELDCENDAAVHNLRAAEAGRLRPPEAGRLRLPSAVTEGRKDEPHHGS